MAATRMLVALLLALVACTLPLQTRSAPSEFGLANLPSAVNEILRKGSTKFGDGVLLQRRLATKDLVLVNEILSVITAQNPLQLEVTNLGEVFIPRAQCQLAGLACVAVTIYFQNPDRSLPYFANCYGFSIEDVLMSSEYAGLNMTPPEFDANPFDESDWESALLALDGGNSELIWKYARFTDLLNFNLQFLTLRVSCELSLKVVPSTISEDPTPDTPAATGTMFFNITTSLNASSVLRAGDGQGRPSNLNEESYLTSSIFIGPEDLTNYTWSRFGPEYAEELDPLVCVNKVAVQNITFAASGLETVNVEVFGIGIQSVELDDALPETLNDPANPNRALAVEPIEELLCNLTTTLIDTITNLMLSLPTATDPATYLKDSESLPLSQPLEVEASFLPLRPGSVLADIGDNFITNLVGLFPEDSQYISGEDPSSNAISELAVEFLDVQGVPNGSDPILYILDALFNTTLVEDVFPLNRIDVIELLVNVTGDLVLNLTADDGGRLNFSFSIAILDDTPALEINISLAEVYFSYRERTDAPPPQERFFLDQIRLLTPQTLQLPTLRFGDIEIEVTDLQLTLAFFGGATLVEPSAPGAEDPSVFELLLPLLPPFVLPSVTPDYTTGSATFDTLTLFWNDFFAELSVTVPVDATAFGAVELGPLLENLVDCALSSFYETPRLSGFVTNAESIAVEWTLPTDVDGLLAILLDLVGELALPVFQGLVPYMAEVLVNSSVYNTELIEPFECGRAVEVPGEEFYFNTTFFSQLEDFVTEGLVETVVDGLFAKGETPETADYNQIIPDPIRLFGFDNVPSANGLNVNVDFVIARIEVSGVSPANFTTFQLLDVDEARPQFINSRLAVGVPENPVRLRIAFELNTKQANRAAADRSRVLAFDDTYNSNNNDDEEPWWARAQPAVLSVDEERHLQAATPSTSPTAFPTTSPTLPQPTVSPVTSRPTRAPSTSPTAALLNGEEENRLVLDVTFESVEAVLDLWLRFMAFDLESTRLEDALSFDCWMGKLQPYGGPTDIQVVLRERTMRLDCEYCSSPILRDLSARFSNPQSVTEFFDFLNQVLDFAATALENLFKEDEWEINNRNFQRRCAGNSTEARESRLGEFAEDLGEVYVFTGMTFIVMMTIGCSTCYCVKAPHEKKHRKIGADGAVGAMAGAKFAGVGGSLDFLEDVGNKEHIVWDLEHTTLFNHHTVPTWAKFFIPFLFVFNLVLFIIGHVGQAVSVSVIAGIAGIPIELRDFQSISVIQSAQILLEGGGYFLAILIIGLSIMWPYLKISGMAIAWFTPVTRLSFHKRGILVKRLDQMGKWSLIELYFLIFIIIAFKLQVSSPEITFLPAGFYVLGLEITPQFSIYAFCTALVISLATSNLIGVYHEKIEKQMIHVLREPRKTDEFPISLTDFRFPVEEQTATVGLTSASVVVLGALCMASILTLLVGASVPTLGAEIVGLASLILEIEGKSPALQYSIFTFFELIFGGSSAGEMYLGAFFGLTILVIPAIQLVTLLYMLLGRFTLRSAIATYEANQFLCAWACVEVFVVGIAVVVLEVGQISGGISAGACDFLQDPMETYLLPLGLVDVVDVQNTCFAILGSLLPGAYVLFFCIILANTAHYAVTLGFQKMIVTRLDVGELFDNHASGKLGRRLAATLERFKMLERGEGTSAVAI